MLWPLSLWVYIVVVVVNCTFLLIFRYFLVSFKGTQASQSEIPISIVIAAKNEAENLRKHLPHILNQDYPMYEVVVVNDGSRDNSEDLLKDFSNTCKYLKVITLQDSKGKKPALTTGIEASKHEHLLFTDADCKPATTNWITSMASQFKCKSLILGYGAYKPEQTFLNKLIRFETLFTAVQYFGFAHLGFPYMGVGRNLGYTKALFKKANGYKAHQHISSGDDDLFVSQVATAKITGLNISAESFTYSIPKSRFQDWIFQKRRHITTSNYYSNLHKSLLGLFFLSNVLFWVLSFCLIGSNAPFLGIALPFIFREFVQLHVIYRAAVRFKESKLWFISPILEICLLGVQSYIFIANIVSKPRHWD